MNTQHTISKWRDEDTVRFSELRQKQRDQPLTEHELQELARLQQRFEAPSKEPIDKAGRDKGTESAVSVWWQASPLWAYGVFGLLVVALVGCGVSNTIGNGSSEDAAIAASDPTATVPSSSLTPTPTLGIGSTRVSEVDGMTQHFVPAGEFQMGISEEEIDLALTHCDAVHGEGVCQRSWFADEQPQHTVNLDSFWIDETEVTVKMYKQCVADGACTKPTQPVDITEDRYYDNEAFANYPVVYVKWDWAGDYCAWAGRELPTEAQWEKAARGTDGRLYPWGDEFDGERVNSCDSNCSENWVDDRLDDRFDDRFASTAPVGTYLDGASPYGAYDMAGNVWEWVADVYDADYYATEDATGKDPEGPSSGTFRLWRGGSFFNDNFSIRTTNRSFGRGASRAASFIGFRCAQR